LFTKEGAFSGKFGTENYVIMSYQNSKLNAVIKTAQFFLLLIGISIFYKRKDEMD